MLLALVNKHQAVNQLNVIIILLKTAIFIFSVIVFEIKNNYFCIAKSKQE